MTTFRKASNELAKIIASVGPLVSYYKIGYEPGEEKFVVRVYASSGATEVAARFVNRDRVDLLHDKWEDLTETDPNVLIFRYLG